MRMSSPPKVKTPSPGVINNNPRLNTMAMKVNSYGRSVPNNMVKPPMTPMTPMTPMSRKMSPNKPRTMPNGSKSMPMKNSAY